MTPPTSFSISLFHVPFHFATLFPSPTSFPKPPLPPLLTWFLSSLMPIAADVICGARTRISNRAPSLLHGCNDLTQIRFGGENRSFQRKWSRPHARNNRLLGSASNGDVFQQKFYLEMCVRKTAVRGARRKGFALKSIDSVAFAT
jgi:hypothetical protein